MSSVGCRVAGRMVLLGLLGCSAAPPPAAVAAKAVVAPAEPTPGEAPPLTPAPPGSPSMVLDLDLTAFFSAVTAGTGVRLEPALVSQLWSLPGMDATRPVALLMGRASGDSWVLSTMTAAGASFDTAPPDGELAKRELEWLRGANCALRRQGGDGQALFCGNRSTVLSFADALTQRRPPPLATAMAQVSFRLPAIAGHELEELRVNVTRSADALLPRGSALGDDPAARSALVDMGFELVDRIVQGYQQLGPLGVVLSPEREGKLAFRATLEPAPGSALARAMAAAQPVRVPAAFWELSDRTDSALLVDGSAFEPLLEPSARTLGLLTQVKGGGPVLSDWAALRSACFKRGQAVLHSRGRRVDERPAAGEPGPPQLKPFPPPETAEPPSVTFYVIEDPGKACNAALSALLASHARLSATGSGDQKSYVQSLPNDDALPKGVRLLQLGQGAEPDFVSLVEHRAALWIGASSDLAALKEAARELLLPAAKRRSLKTRPELKELGKTPALIVGFVREDALPLAGSGQRRKTFTSALASADDAKVPLVPFAIAQEGPALRVGGELEASRVRRSFAKVMGETWSRALLDSSSGPARTAAMELLDASCRLGGGAACNWLGVTYGDGRGVTADKARAVALLERGCEHDSGMACANLAFYRDAELAEQLKLFQKACDLEAAFGCAWWGVRLLEQAKPEDQQRAFDKLRLGCDGFVGFACARIGWHYREGDLLPQDAAKSADFYERACRLNLGAGCVELAGAFVTGRGRAHDETHAFELLQRACRLDRGEGCYALGLSHLNGRGTSKSEAAAREQFDTACQAEHAEACRLLAEMAGEP